MTDKPWGERGTFKRGRVVVQPGQPLVFADVVESEIQNDATASVVRTIGTTLIAYRNAVRDLVEGRYAAQRSLAPPHMREPCDIFVLQCNDGTLVRYDKAVEEKPKLRCAKMDCALAQVATPFSDHVIHFPSDPATYVPDAGGPEIQMVVTDPSGGQYEVGRIRTLVFATTKLPAGFELPPPPARPPCLAAIQNEFDLQLRGAIAPANEGLEGEGSRREQFIAHSRVKLNVGWQTIELYPPLGDEHWKPEYAPLWAELDLLAALAQANATTSALHAIDGRGAARRFYADLLDEFETLLTGAEEPVHQFLKRHPELLCPTNVQWWSKLPFGDRVSDFVFREPHDDYLLVELEAPIRELFRKDGQQREELTHAINQLTDWVQFISDNRSRVEQELGLTGISTNPRTLVVIGRSHSLTEANRKKLATLQAQQNKLRILTYDDLYTTARANLERIVGPLTLRTQNVEVYYFK